MRMHTGGNHQKHDAQRREDEASAKPHALPDPRHGPCKMPHWRIVRQVPPPPSAKPMRGMGETCRKLRKKWGLNLAGASLPGAMRIRPDDTEHDPPGHASPTPGGRRGGCLRAPARSHGVPNAAGDIPQSAREEPYNGPQAHAYRAHLCRAVTNAAGRVEPKAPMPYQAVPNSHGGHRRRSDSTLGLWRHVQEATTSTPARYSILRPPMPQHTPSFGPRASGDLRPLQLELVQS